MSWKNNKFFKKPFYVDDDSLDMDHLTKFQKKEILSADTETKLYYKNKLIDDETAYNLLKSNGVSWCKENIEVRAYAFMIADDHDFLIFQCPEDFMTACSLFRAKYVFWYNAKFDFAIFDYWILSNKKWKNANNIIEKMKGRYGKMPALTYASLNGEFGQRYQYKIWYAYKNKSGHDKVHCTTFVDTCNISGGGLAKNLKDFDIRDNSGNPIRKLDMDYSQADFTNQNDINYMKNDTVGLYFLSKKLNDTFFDLTGYSLFKGDYITIGGLAKKTLLKFMFNSDDKTNVRLFKSFFPITIDDDKEFRQNQLYLGGKALVNHFKVGLINKNVYKFDVNSMYPDKMRNMYYPIGEAKHITLKSINKNCIHIYVVENFCGALKKNMIPVWQDHLSGDYVDIFQEPEKRYIWEEELEEIKNWYDIEYDIIDILEFKKGKCIGAQKFVDTFYDIKKNAKGAVRQCAKILLNSAYGKIAQRVERTQCDYEMSDKGYVHLVEKRDENGNKIVDLDENSMLSVVVGSRITALARVSLMIYIREICGNVKENFLYCDTDSVHSLMNYDKCDDSELGLMKNEGNYDYATYLAPKSYIMSKKGIDNSYHYEVHCKGVNVKVVENEIKNIKSFPEALNIFRPNRTFKCLSALNVRGGKALIYVDKMIMNDKNEVVVRKINKECEEYYE